MVSAIIFPRIMKNYPGDLSQFMWNGEISWLNKYIILIGWFTVYYHEIFLWVTLYFGEPVG